MNVEYICVGAFIIALLILLLLLILHKRPFKYQKTSHGLNTTLTITANKNLHKVTVEAQFGSEEIKFERKRIRKGMTVDFTYPKSDKPAKIIVEVDQGKPKVFQV